ncbi:MAG: cation-transporting P-type ATPase, partial [Bacteroidales bacterium]|nr:cation-transporting P-type ATPase [Bacteroidales bacterium]
MISNSERDQYRDVNQFAGLTTEQAEQSRKEHGANLLTPPQREPLWRVFLRKFSDPIIRILL